MTCLVVGATGFVGGRVARILRERGTSVRALVRGGASHPKSGELRAAGIEIADGDVTRPESLAPACRGIDVVVSTVTSMPTGADDGLRRVDHDGALALIDAAERAGVQKFVYISYSGNIDQPSPLATAKRGCEERLRASAMQAVILRPSYFAEIWLSPALGFDARNGKARIFGSGDAKVSYVSAVDVAAFAVAAAAGKQAAKTTVLELGGPDALSLRQVIATFEKAMGRAFSVETVPIEALQAQLGATDPLQATFAALTYAYAKGDMIEGARETAARYGIELRSVAELASEMAA
jgi:NADH dehydrogenase